MQFSTLILAAFASFAVASPLVEERASLCSSSIDSANCCSLSVDGIANLACESPAGSPKSLWAFNKACASVGKEATCCTLVVDGVGVVCNAP